MSGSDPRKIRATLEAAEGYAVFDAEGKRLGAFVGLAADDRIAIRHDGVFVWRRRLLPITDVVNVIPDQRAVVLKVSKRTLAETEAPASQVQDTDKRYLFFIATPAGYSLAEQEGPPPRRGDRIEIPGQATSFLVVKLGPSPLPNDRRSCAYLEPTAEITTWVAV